MAFASSLDPDQARQNVGPDLDPNCLTLMLFLQDFFWEKSKKKNQQVTNYHEKITQYAES